jgi:hypothetical protein
MELRTLGYVWIGHSVEGYYYTRRQTGLWSTQAQGEGIVLKAAWHGVSNSSVVRTTLGNLAATH